MKKKTRQKLLVIGIMIIIELVITFLMIPTGDFSTSAVLGLFGGFITYLIIKKIDTVEKS
jgi:hypothetical protein